MSFDEADKLLTKTPMRDRDCTVRVLNGAATGAVGSLAAAWIYTSWTATRSAARLPRFFKMSASLLPFATMAAATFPLVECNFNGFSSNKIVNAGVAGFAAGVVLGTRSGNLQAALGTGAGIGALMMFTEFATKISQRPIDNIAPIHSEDFTPSDVNAWHKYTAQMNRVRQSLETRA